MLACDSPPFPNTIKATIKAATRGEDAGLTARALRRVSLRKELRDDRVEKWLDGAVTLEEFHIYDDFEEPVEIFNNVKEPEDDRSSFHILAEPGRCAAADPWKRVEKASPRRALRDMTGQLSPRRVFKDVSNLQRPGYLGKLSKIRRQSQGILLTFLLDRAE